MQPIPLTVSRRGIGGESAGGSWKGQRNEPQVFCPRPSMTSVGVLQRKASFEDDVKESGKTGRGDKSRDTHPAGLEVLQVTDRVLFEQ